MPRAYALTRLSLAGDLTGLSATSGGRDLRVKPFVLGGQVRDTGENGFADPSRGRGGRKVRINRWPDARRDGEPGLRPGGGGRAAREPDSVLPLLSGEARVLPGELGALLRGGRGPQYPGAAHPPLGGLPAGAPIAAGSSREASAIHGADSGPERSGAAGSAWRSSHRTSFRQRLQ